MTYLSICSGVAPQTHAWEALGLHCAAFAESERLQGFPDHWTRIPWRGKPESECPDGPRYRAIGKSWAVPVLAWIGERLSGGAWIGERLGSARQ